MSKFKIGDKVEVVERYHNNEVGKVGIITSISVGSNPYYRINGGTWGAPDYFLKKLKKCYNLIIKKMNLTSLKAI